jgi:ribosomal protein L10
MAITKQQKKTLIEQYVQDLTGAKNTVIVRQSAINVPLSTSIRKDVLIQEGKLNVVRKRLFMRALKEAGMEEIELPQLDGSIFALYAHENEFGPLKAVNKYLKDFKRINKGQEVTFL